MRKQKSRKGYKQIQIIDREMFRSDPDNLPPHLAVLKIQELVLVLEGHRASLDAAIAKVKQGIDTESILAIKGAGQNIQIVANRLTTLHNRVNPPSPPCTKSARMPSQKDKVKANIPSKRVKQPRGYATGWIVGSGQTRKPGSHKS